MADVVAPGEEAAAAERRAARLPVRPGEGGARWLIAIMGGCDRKGRWRLREQLTSLNIMGGSDFDLNDAELSAQRTEMTIFSLMGGSDVHVPEGLNVEVTDFAFMGGNDVDVRDSLPDPGGPVLHLRLISIMGGTNVRRGRRRTREERRAEKRLHGGHLDRRAGEEEEPDLEREHGEHDRGDEDGVERADPRALRVRRPLVERLEPRRSAPARPGGPAARSCAAPIRFSAETSAAHSTAIATTTTSTAVIVSAPASPCTREPSQIATSGAPVNRLIEASAIPARSSSRCSRAITGARCTPSPCG